jgi:TIR domain-containing protein/HEAT repeat protein
MSHIFICYNQADADFAAILRNQIEKAGIDTWMDMGRLRPGQDWSEEIDQAIMNAYALVVIMSPEAKTSEYVTYEWSFALGAGIKVIPVLYKETSLHPRLARLHYLKFTDHVVRPWEDFINCIKEAANSSGLYVVRVPRNALPHVKNAVLALDNPNSVDRVEAIRILAQTDHPSAKEALIYALQHPIQGVRWDAALHISEEQNAIPVLIEAILNANSLIREATQAHILNFGKPALTSLIDALKITTKEQQERVGETLWGFIDTDLETSLVGLLHDPNPSIRRGAVLALKQNGSDFADEAILNAVQDSNEDVRIAAAHRLSNWDYGLKSIDARFIAIQDASVTIRHLAIESFRRTPDDSVKRRMLNVLRDEQPHVAFAAYKALFIMDGTNGAVLKDWIGQCSIESQTDSSQGAQLYVIERLGAHRSIKMYDIHCYIILHENDDEIELCEIDEDNQTGEFVLKGPSLSFKKGVMIKPIGIRVHLNPGIKPLESHSV